MAPRAPIKDLDKFREQFVRWTLRRASFRWPARSEALRLARVSRGTYKCANCEGLFGNKETKLDHIEPVVSITQQGIDYEAFIKRLLCPASGLQVLCRECHDIKTKGENDARREYRKRIKE